MKTKKMSLSNIEGKLSRSEMKNIMAGDDDFQQPVNNCSASCSGSCSAYGEPGSCSYSTIRDHCYCVGVQ